MHALHSPLGRSLTHSLSCLVAGTPISSNVVGPLLGGFAPGVIAGVGGLEIPAPAGVLDGVGTLGVPVRPDKSGREGCRCTGGRIGLELVIGVDGAEGVAGGGRGLLTFGGCCCGRRRLFSIGAEKPMSR